MATGSVSYTFEMAHRTCRVTRIAERPARSWRERLRRGKTVRSVQLVGVFILDKQSFDVVKRLHAPDTLDVAMSGRSLL